MRLRTIIGATLLAALSMPLAAQTETLCGPDASADLDKTLGELARFARKAPASHARLVLNDENPPPHSPIPDIALDGETNDKQISDSYLAYAGAHARSDIDRTVREWYDAQVAYFAKLHDDVAHIQDAQSGYYSGYFNPSENYDPQRAREQAMLAQAGQRADQHTIQRDNQQMQRLSSALARLRFLFDPKGTRYEWFVTNLNP